MNPPAYLMTVAWLGAISPLSAAVLVDDEWADGDRSATNLPEESAWYASSVAGTPTLSTDIGALTGHVLLFETNTSSRLWITHFAPAGSPAELVAGEALTVTLEFTPLNVTTSPSTSRGLRIGLFNFSETGAVQVMADGFSTGSGTGAPGANVTGYLLNMNFAQAFTIGNPLQIMKRTDLPNINLMGASGVFTALGSGGGAASDPGFVSGRPYTLGFSVKHLGSSVEITTRFSDQLGWGITNVVTDAVDPVVRFDGFAFRPNSVMDSAESFVFTRFKAEQVSYAPTIVSIAPDLSLFGMKVTWESLPGRIYEFQARATLDASTPWEVLLTVPSDGPVTSATDLDAFFMDQRFYQVVELP